jgi:hypothetical protein
MGRHRRYAGRLGVMGCGCTVVDVCCCYGCKGYGGRG